jgi:radical SAM superfamily enzyme YgiQ (UPF0313 family)
MNFHLWECQVIRFKTISKLRELKNMGLDRIYMGLESGHDDVLLRIKKAETAQSMAQAAQRVGEVKIFLSVTVF